MSRTIFRLIYFAISPFSEQNEKMNMLQFVKNNRKISWWTVVNFIR